MKSFPVVNFEIVGNCNARCPYCVTGKKSQPKGGVVDISVFKNVIHKILEEGLFEKGKSALCLYNWGEPFLHPRFNELVGVINGFDINYVLSTNASIVPAIDKDTARNLADLCFSMPGFSQDSYDRIHGFDFETIKHNIRRIVQELRECGYKGSFIILYHIYQFNLHEMRECEQFASELGAVFSPLYARLVDWWQAQALLKGDVPYKELKDASKDLFLYHFWDKIEKSPRKGCWLHDQLTIDEYGRVATCCALPRNHKDYCCGDLLKDNIKDILKKKITMPVCKECIGSGFSNAFTMSTPPQFYRTVLPEKLNKIELTKQALQKLARKFLRDTPVQQ